MAASGGEGASANESGASQWSERFLAAQGTFVHVYVGADGKPVPIPPKVRGVLEAIAA
jgi:acyl-CoA thioesterase FadM